MKKDNDSTNLSLGKNIMKFKLFFVASFFVLYFVLGISIYKDFGISWDEPTSRLNGMVNLKYILSIMNPEYVLESKELSAIPSLESYADRDYGVAFQLPISAIEYWLGFSDSQDIYLARHLITFIISLLGVISIYKLSNYRFNDWRIALFGTLLYIMSPRLFAGSFYNDKDVIFMAFFSVAMYTAIRFTVRPNYISAVLHAVATAIAIDIRIMGGFIACITPFLILLLVLQKRITLFRGFILCLTYILSTLFITVLAWPYLWNSPFHNLLEAFQNMAKFRWKGSVLYMGELISATELPWHYPLVWVLITTPLPYVFLFFVGASAIMKNCVTNMKKSWVAFVTMQDVFMLTTVIVPLAAVIFLNSVLYDGWRQLYFIYPAFILVSLTGWIVLVKNCKAHFGIKGITVVSTLMVAALLWVFIWMIKAHPFQNVYFNVLAGNEVKSKYEVDYWGLGNRMALEWIAKNDPSNFITVSASSHTPLETSLFILPSATRERFKIRNSITTDYVLTNYRGDSPSKMEKKIKYNLRHQIKVDGEPIISIYEYGKKKDVIFNKLTEIDFENIVGGITGQLYLGTNFEKYSTEIDSNLKGPPFNKYNPNHIKTDYSIRMKGFIYFDISGWQTLCVVSDDGVRLYIDDELIIEDWTVHPPITLCEKLNIEQGWYPITIDYFQQQGGEILELLHGKSELDAVQLPAEHLCCR